MNKLLSDNLNLQLVPVETSKRKRHGNYCRHCGKAVAESLIGLHLLDCRPDIAEAIAREYDGKEAHAVSLTN
jgi:hypothetical protein